MGEMYIRPPCMERICKRERDFFLVNMIYTFTVEIYTYMITWVFILNHINIYINKGVK